MSTRSAAATRIVLEIATVCVSILKPLYRATHGYLKQHPEAVRGTRNPRSKLTEDDVRAIRSTYRAGGITQKALGARYDVSKTVVQHILSGKLWSHVS